LGALGHIFWHYLVVLFFVKLIMGVGGTLVFVGTEVLINYSSTSENRGKNIGLYATLLSIGIAIGTLLIWTVEISEYFPFVFGSIIMLVVTAYISFLLKPVKLTHDSGAEHEFKLKDMPLIGVFSALVYGLFETSVIVAIPIYGLRIGFDRAEVSYLLASFVIGGIVLLYLISYLSDRLSKYNVLLYVSVALTGLLLIPIFHNGFTGLTVLMFFIGGIVPAFYTIGLGYTADMVNKEYISEANGYYVMMYGLGTIIGPLWGALLLEFNLETGYWAVSSLLCVIFFVIFYFQKNNK